MAKKKQEQQEQSQDEHVMAILDKRTNKTAVVSKMNEQDGSLEIVPPDKKNSSSFLKLDRTSPLELFFTNFKNQYENPTSFSFFLVPLVLLEKTLNAVVQIRKGEDPGVEGKKLVENSELNDEGRIAKLARRYKFDEHQLPWKELAALGVDKQLLFDNHCMGEMLKGRITSMAFPISKEVNGEKKDMGEACFLCVKGEDGKVQLKTLSRLDKPQYDLPAYKGVFTDEEKQSLKDTGTLGAIKEMKDTIRERSATVMYPFMNRATVSLPYPWMPSRYPIISTGKGWMTNRSKSLRQEAGFPSTTYSAKTIRCFPVWPSSIRE